VFRAVQWARHQSILIHLLIISISITPTPQPYDSYHHSNLRKPVMRVFYQGLMNVLFFSSLQALGDRRNWVLRYKKTISRWLLTVTGEWLSCTKWDSYVFPNLINNMWVLRTPLTHKTTHKKLGWILMPYSKC
jgi:hypothetical protein